MALVEEVKKGCPYTKKEQDVRRKEVYRLHFELGYPAVKIADLMKINRNTINADINFLYSQLAEQWKTYDTNSLIFKQIQRLELQRGRLYEELDKQDKFSDKFIIEKLLFEIDNRITQIYSKVLPYMELQPSNGIEITDGEIKNFVKNLVKKQSLGTSPRYYKTPDLTFEIMKLTKCEQEYASAMCDKMKLSGLDACKNYDDLVMADISPEYDILKFAEMRGFLSDNEINQLRKNT